MTVDELAKDFTNMLKAGDHEGAAGKYNAPDIVSYEAMGGNMAVCRGSEAVRKKSDWWNENHIVHGGTTEGPFVNGDEFVVRFSMDVTTKATGERAMFHEVGLYKVAGGKIASERFFYLQG